MESLETAKIGFIGFGSIASAMADGLIKSGRVSAENLHACAGHFDALQARTDARGMHAEPDAAALVDAVDLVIVAIKPDKLESVLSPLAAKLANKPILSVAVNWGCSKYDALLPGTRHISTLPNLSVSICEGVTVCEQTHTLTAEEHDLALELLGCLGVVAEVKTELLGAAGAVSGSGPAFIAMVIEALADAAVKHGVPRAIAYKITSQMVAGTAKLQLETGALPAALKDAVCSPGGTTIQGVTELEVAGVRAAFIRAIDATEGHE